MRNEALLCIFNFAKKQIRNITNFTGNQLIKMVLEKWVGLIETTYPSPVLF